jgi:hypothetical protein
MNIAQMHKLEISYFILLSFLDINSTEGHWNVWKRVWWEYNVAILSILVYDTRYLQVEFCEWKFAMTA